MSRRMSLSIAWFFGALSSACDKPPDLPPEAMTGAKPQLDTRHVAVLGGKENILVPNVTLSLSPLAGDAANVRIELRSEAPSGHNAILLTGVALVAQGQPLQRTRFSVTGPGAEWLGPNEGVRSDEWRYQPESATIILDQIDDREASGRIEGNFYRFDRRKPRESQPEPQTIRGTFQATVLKSMP